jgi:hypothetical protein
MHDIGECEAHKCSPPSSRFLRTSAALRAVFIVASAVPLSEVAHLSALLPMCSEIRKYPADSA